MTLKSKIKTKLREGDEVIVLAGRDVGKTGNILKIAGRNKALVSGINMVKKHTKPNPQLGVTGGIEEKESPIDLSNLSFWDSKKKIKEKIIYKLDEKSGKKTRIFQSTGKKVD